MTAKVLKVHKHIGAIIKHVDITKPMSKEVIEQIKKAFHKHSVIIFKNQNLTPNKHILFTKIFGELDIHPLNQFHLRNFPEILVLSNVKDSNNQPIGLEDAGQYWHTDVSFTAKPSLGSMLHAKKIPPAGGDTLFSSQYAAWEKLSNDWKEKLSKLRALHGLNEYTAPKWTKEQLSKVKLVDHPLIRVHPETNKKAIYAGKFAIKIKGKEREDSKKIIEYLYHHCSKKEFIYRHKWEKNDLVLWDNRCVLHHATMFDKKYTRHMHRTTIKGDIPQ